MTIPPEKKRKIDSLLERTEDVVEGTEEMLEESSSLEEETAQLEATSDYLLEDQKKREEQARKMKRAL